MADNKIVVGLTNTESEIRFIGSLFLNNDLFLEYEKVIEPKYYFSDEVCRNYYDWLSVLYSNNQKFNEKNFSIYVNQSEERISFYRKMEGWKTISSFMELSEPSEFKSYFQTMQKFALLREFEAIGFDTTSIRAHKNFDKATPDQIYKTIRNKTDKVHTAITADAEVLDVTTEVVSMINDFIDRPAMGTPTFLPTYNELFLGFQKKSMMCFGLMSNFGKTRFLSKIAAYNALVQKEKTLIMSNEMDFKQFKVAILTAVINNEEFSYLHGYNLPKIEREIKLGLYRDADGNLITRLENEQTANYIKRLEKMSKEYRDILEISKWLEADCFNKTLSVLDVRKDYTDGTLANHIRKNARKGYQFIAYDNLKNEKTNLGSWASLIMTTTTLSEAAKAEGVFAFGSLQLTDETANYDVMDLDSNNIAASKGLKTVLDSLILGKTIEKEKYKKYGYIPTTKGFGESSRMVLPLPDVEGFVLQGHIPDKNREGSKIKTLVQVSLDRNIWKELGLLVRAG